MALGNHQDYDETVVILDSSLPALGSNRLDPFPQALEERIVGDDGKVVARRHVAARQHHVAPDLRPRFDLPRRTRLRIGKLNPCQRFVQAGIAKI